jgi:hypothetical protein
VPPNGSWSPEAGLVRLALITAVPVAVLGALGLVTRWWTGQWAADRRARHRLDHPGTPPPLRRPLELVAADVRRLAREVALVPTGTPVARRRGLLAAYDDVLCEAAAALEVPEQLSSAPPSARELERLRLVVALQEAGMVVSG